MIKYYFPFIGNNNIEELLKFAGAYQPLDYLVVNMIDYITEHKNDIHGPIQHVLEILINWIEREILGKVNSFEELQSMLFGHYISEKGLDSLIENMIPYRYYEALSGDEIGEIKATSLKIYKDAINKILSIVLDKPALVPEQLYQKDISEIPQFKKEDIVTPWLEGSKYERI